MVVVSSNPQKRRRSSFSQATFKWPKIDEIEHADPEKDEEEEQLAQLKARIKEERRLKREEKKRLFDGMIKRFLPNSVRTGQEGQYSEGLFQTNEKAHPATRESCCGD